MCLALLAARWAARHDGDVVAVTVDHGLRPDSATEARQVRDWLRAQDIPHQILRWQGPYPASGIQAAARQARYRLLTDYCRDQAILHLLVGHHRDDQAETVLIRQEGSSGRDGLAAMAPISERKDVRLLRPLLEMPRDRLSVTLTAVEQSWIDDPSNDNREMARGRLRARPNDMLLADALTTARVCADERVLAEQATADLAARALRFHPGGFVTIDRRVLMSGAPDIGKRVLARAVMAIAGRRYAPRSERIHRLWLALTDADFPGHTLAGCRLVRQEKRVYVCREAAGIGPPVNLVAGTTGVWDKRFSVSVTKNLGSEARLDALTASGWQQIVARDPNPRMRAIPYAARTVLPALWQGDSVMAVPHLGYVNAQNPLVSADFTLKWQPPLAVAPARFGKV